MALPDEEWMHLAQRLAVGNTQRHYHRRERRPNLVVGHEAGHYWAYCQACHEGGKVTKEHVLVTGVKAPAASTSLSLPRDRILLSRADPFVQDSIALLLAKKNMDAMYLPPLWFSEERKRLLIQTPQGWIGRDTTDNSRQKWLTYEGQTYLCDEDDLTDQHVILVEDTFSWYKVKKALSSATSADLKVACLLGTEIRPPLLKMLMHAKHCHLFLDGDDAGLRGAKRGQRLMRGYGIGARVCTATSGKDPKDLFLAEIRRLCDSQVKTIS